MNSFFNRTIVALVTAPITQNVALIRVSGPKTYPVISQIFNKKLSNSSKRKPEIIFGCLVNNEKQTVDQVLLFCFYSPYSFTGEDLIEISCHGNLFIVDQILQLIIERGVELAQNGEFTKQAFLNNKINLIQSNAINDLIRAPSLVSTKLALHDLDYNKQEELNSIENILLEIIANIKVNIDYPEYDGVDYITGNMVLNKLNALINKLKEIKESSERVRIFQEGIKIAIVGKPNVGKSTLLNCLVKKDRSIVSPLAGTTRDVVEVSYSLKGVPLTLLDTAGIHQTDDVIEKIGVEKSCQVLKEAELIFFLVSNSEKWSREEENIFQKLKEKNFFLIINKKDEKNELIVPSYVKKVGITISAKKGEIQNLEEEIIKMFSSDLINKTPDYPYLSQS
jgi:tRNA modification GTPase